MMAALHDALLDFELPADILERALGRGGAPVDLNRARAAIPEAQAALRRIAELLASGDAP